jgi:hypothetical protein
MRESPGDHRDDHGEEESLPLWMKEAAIKAVPFVLAGAALYVFLKYGALIALMSIFSAVIGFYAVISLVRWIRKLFLKNRGGDA